MLCFGFLYHTYRHTELMYRLNKLAPRHLIVDTIVTPETQRPTLRMMREYDARTAAAPLRTPLRCVRYPCCGPRCPSLQLLLGSYGFEIEPLYDWKGRLAGRPHMLGVRGYAKGKRVSLRCRYRKAAAAGFGAGGPTPSGCISLFLVRLASWSGATGANPAALTLRERHRRLTRLPLA